MQEEVDMVNQQIHGAFSCCPVISIKKYLRGWLLSQSAIARFLLKGKTVPVMLDQCKQQPNITA